MAITRDASLVPLLFLWLAGQWTASLPASSLDDSCDYALSSSQDSAHRSLPPLSETPTRFCTEQNATWGMHFLWALARKRNSCILKPGRERRTHQLARMDLGEAQGVTGSQPQRWDAYLGAIFPAPCNVSSRAERLFTTCSSDGH